MAKTIAKHLTTEQLAEQLSVGKRTIRQWMTDGRIPYLKIGRAVRFDPEKVETALSRYERNTRQ